MLPRRMMCSWPLHTWASLAKFPAGNAEPASSSATNSALRGSCSAHGAIRGPLVVGTNATCADRDTEGVSNRRSEC